MTDARVTLTFTEILDDPDPDTRVTLAFTEILDDPDPDTRVTLAFTEILRAREAGVGPGNFFLLF